MCDNNIMGTIPPIAELHKIQVNPDEILVIKVDTNRFDFSEAYSIYTSIKNELPEGVTAIGIPTGIELEASTVQEMIEALEKLL